ncbi:glycoside hydrolase family 23 protein [Armillaria novae-zelandiae]|uniref:Glycoside hydrolase family 23 protein n=1 Tax=Armillaria novae-zelandiae TaxID=153914 RepID=A0AA39UE22_9AGAR|nr:glycoside hydrolase family 23 protein [Armillaria novae-zelandiae]
MHTNTCGPVGATGRCSPYWQLIPDLTRVDSTTATSGRMGSIDYFNCGIQGSGWTPPYMSMDEVAPRMADLSEAIKKPESPFKPCEPFLPIFQKCAQMYGVPAILVASFALQEVCRAVCAAKRYGCSLIIDSLRAIRLPTGGAGEVGLMQLTQDKCHDAPNGDCYDPEFNILAGCKYFSKQLAANNGDVLLTCGNYNGWFKGMTYADATAAANGPCCRCQNNLDYLHQLLNGWLQNVNAYDPNHRLGKYFNLDQCH